MKVVESVAFSKVKDAMRLLDDTIGELRPTPAQSEALHRIDEADRAIRRR